MSTSTNETAFNPSDKLSVEFDWQEQCEEILKARQCHPQLVHPSESNSAVPSSDHYPTDGLEVNASPSAVFEFANGVDNSQYLSFLYQTKAQRPSGEGTSGEGRAIEAAQPLTSKTANRVGSSGQNTLPARASHAFRARFPRGWRIVSTSGEGLMCGIRALQGSLRHQVPDFPTPSFDQLTDIAWNGKAAIAFMETQVEEDFDTEFRADHLAGILAEVGEQSNVRLQLGLRLPNNSFYVLRTGEEAEVTTVWVDHNGEVGKKGHYSGMASADAAKGSDDAWAVSELLFGNEVASPSQVQPSDPTNRTFLFTSRAAHNDLAMMPPASPAATHPALRPLSVSLTEDILSPLSASGRTAAEYIAQTYARWKPLRRERNEKLPIIPRELCACYFDTSSIKSKTDSWLLRRL